MTTGTEPTHVHPITPVLKAANAVPGVLVFVVIAFTAAGLTVTPSLFFGALAAVMCIPAAIGGWSFLVWRRLTFCFDSDGDFRVASGVLVRRERRVQLSRLQAVDVTQPLIARVTGFAVLTIEVAGMTDSRVTLAYFPLRQAQGLRANIVARAAGMRPEVGEAPQHVILQVPTSRLIAGLLARSSTVGLALLTAVIVTVTVLSQGWGGLALAVTTGGVPILIVLIEFTMYYGFTIAQSPDGLRLTYGLLQKQTRTIPPGRVQAIDIVEPFLWRRFGWARLRINIAGVGNAEANSQQRETLLTPIATSPEVIELIGSVFSGADPRQLDWQHVPRSVRWRSPLQWRCLAVARTPACLWVQRGLMTRHRTTIPHARTQSLRLTQGPWERALNLATVHIDTTPGPVRVTALHRPFAEALHLLETQWIAAASTRQTDHWTHWMRSPS